MSKENIPDSIRDKGDELIDKFLNMEYQLLKEYFPSTHRQVATSCAIIAVGEIIDQIKNLCKPEYTSFFHGEMGSGTTLDGYELKDYWNEVLTYLNSKL